MSSDSQPITAKRAASATAADGYPAAAGADGLAPPAITRIMLRPLASSLPLGFMAFGAGTVLLSALELGWVQPHQGASVMVLVLAFVVPLEVLAGILAFLARDGGAATGLSVLGAAWAGIAITSLHLPPLGRSSVLGIFVLFLAAVMLMLVVGAVRSRPLFGGLLAIGACRFALTGVFQITGSGATEKASGWLGLPLLALCLYGGTALLLEDGEQRTVLPLGRRGRARTSLEGDIAGQIEQAEREAGIRRML